MKTQNKDVNFEINLLPVISLLAVCISFLLLTTVWIHIGTLDVKQALGEATEQEKAEEHPKASLYKCPKSLRTTS